MCIAALLQSLLKKILEGDYKCIFSTGEDAAAAAATEAEVIARANDLYEKAQDSLKAGDLALYAEYIDQLGNLLQGWEKE